MCFFQVLNFECGHKTTKCFYLCSKAEGAGYGTHIVNGEVQYTATEVEHCPALVTDKTIEKINVPFRCPGCQEAIKAEARRKEREQRTHRGEDHQKHGGKGGGKGGGKYDNWMGMQQKSDKKKR